MLWAIHYNYSRGGVESFSRLEIVNVETSLEDVLGKRFGHRVTSLWCDGVFGEISLDLALDFVGQE